MTIPTYSENQENMRTLLERVDQEGIVRIRREDGKTYLLQPERQNASPFDVPGVNLEMTTQEILDFIQEGRRGV